MTEPIVTIVDDDEAVRDSLALLLNFRGYRTRAFCQR
jgi:FixJ family two-component response regulator